MCSAVVLVAATIGLEGSLTHYGLTDDEGGALGLCLSLDDGCTDLVGVVTVDRDNLPVPCLVLLGYVFACYLVTCGRELDVVAVVEHDEVVQTEGTGDAACAL